MCAGAFHAHNGAFRAKSGYFRGNFGRSNIHTELHVAMRVSSREIWGESLLLDVVALFSFCQCLGVAAEGSPPDTFMLMRDVQLQRYPPRLYSLRGVNPSLSGSRLRTVHRDGSPSILTLQPPPR